jgi:predicted nucleic acid-binding protein
VIIVADAGPLIALAKINGLAGLFDLYPHLLITPAVYQEAIVAGLALNAQDAQQLQNAYAAGRMEMRTPALDAWPALAHLGAGEAESIRLAIELRADGLLVDDLDARRAAAQSFQAARVPTVVQGTLGAIAASCQAGRLSRDKALDLIEAIKGRPDIWISADLCDRVIEALRQARA